MAKSEEYEKAIFDLGDQARDLLANQAPPLPAMERVFDAEEALLARRQEMEALEQELNEVDETYRSLLARQEAERTQLQPVVKRFKKAVDGIEGRVRDIRKKLATARQESRMNRDSLKAAEARQADLEMATNDRVKIEQGRSGLKRMRVSVLRKEREIGDLEAELAHALTPEPGQPGAEGIEAHRRILEMEDQATAQKEETDRRMSELDQAIAQKDAEMQDAEDDLHEALYLLGEDCYTRRVPNPKLTDLYRRLDKLQ